jgi:hypothetical protein
MRSEKAIKAVLNAMPDFDGDPQEEAWTRVFDLVNAGYLKARRANQRRRELRRERLAKLGLIDLDAWKQAQEARHTASFRAWIEGG